MLQTFKKSVGGKNLQFNRLLYPVRYSLKLDEEGSNGRSVEFKKAEDGNWEPLINEQGEFWFEENADEIKSIIQENEVKSN